MASFAYTSFFLALTILITNYVTGYGYGTGSTAPPQRSTSPPKYQAGDREQWGGPDHGDHGDHYEQSGNHGSSGGNRGSSDYDRDQGSNYFARSTHVERYGHPEGCADTEDPVHLCDYFVEIAKDKWDPKSLHFEISGHILDPKNGGYVAMGLSKDKHMGEDHIIECVLLADGSTKVYHSWSHSKTEPERLTDDPNLLFMDDKYPDYKNDILTCKFRRPIETDVEINGRYVKFDLIHDKYYVLIATGPVFPYKSDKVGFHGKKKENKVYVSPGLLGYSEKKFPTTTEASVWDRSHGNGGQNVIPQTSIVFFLTLFLYFIH